MQFFRQSVAAAGSKPQAGHHSNELWLLAEGKPQMFLQVAQPHSLAFGD